jgi:hypothetical protein
MKLIWLRQQYQAYSDAVWILQNRAIELKRYLRGNPGAIAALDRLEQIAAEVSRAISEGDTDRVKELAEEASKKRSAVARAGAKSLISSQILISNPSFFSIGC